uniref:Fibrinogen C-terminal domain-containing protein n=1 Tax=Setaria digitata TaxID=48799 RepID=A0A915Q7J5_9BILA
MNQNQPTTTSPVITGCALSPAQTALFYSICQSALHRPKKYLRVANGGSQKYPGHIGGRCLASFDCDPNGARVCMPLTTVRDCFADCPNAADEECPANTVLCDSKISHGCGKCVKLEERDMRCRDRRWRNICSEAEHFKCAQTDNCVLPNWIADGIDDCADGSDEDLCALQSPGCNETNISSAIASPFDVDAAIKRPMEGCLEGEFRCIISQECISVVNVLDGIEQCSDGSDEKYCKEMAGSEMCQKPEQCSFNPVNGMFTCDCPLGYSRTSSGLCIPSLAPVFSSDCADLQKRYHSVRSGLFRLNDWSCSNPDLCPFTAQCEMDLLGGGWTIIMQRFNTSLSFDKNILEYENGFSIDKSNFWIGLERMHQLTSRPQCSNELLLRLRTARNGQIILVRYSHFIVFEKLMDYRLTVNELAHGQLCPFVTSSEKECEGGGGWWRKGCQQRGVLTALNKAYGTYPGLNWNGKRLSAVQMLIRPRGYVPPAKKSY